MNDQLKTALADILTKSSDAVSAGIGFLQAELPEVIHQLLMWKAILSGLSMLGSIALFSALLYFYYRIFIQIKKHVDDPTDHPELVLLHFTPILWILPMVLFSLDWLQILVAPKIYLIEYAARLAK